MLWRPRPPYPPRNEALADLTCVVVLGAVVNRLQIAFTKHVPCFER